jgi:predicted DNA-binding transcriptional regulator YafY
VLTGASGGGLRLRPVPEPASRARVLLVLAEAARTRTRVRLAHRSWRGAAGERALDPYGLVFHAGRWYLTGHDHSKSEVRTFRVDRVDVVVPTAETFAEPGGFDPVAHVTAALASVPYRHEVEVVLETGIDQARRRIPASVATLREVDGGVLMVARAERLDGMAQMLAGLGWPFTVRAPAELRAEVHALAARLASFADR